MSNGNGHVPERMTGAIPLDSHMLQERVREILTARMNQGFGEPPVVKRPIQIAHGGSPQSVDVNVVRGACEQQFWSIVGELKTLGIDSDEGEFSLVDGAVGSDPKGNSACVFDLTWRHRDAVEYAPPKIVT